MKIRLFFTFLGVLLLAGCSALQAPSKRSTALPVDISRPGANSAYYEFTSSPLDRPSVLDDMQYRSATASQEEVVVEDEEEYLDEAEDFTASNISGAYGTYGDVVITVATHKFQLGEQATRTDMTRFQRALDSGYSAALQQYRPVGFTYSMSSVGAVNPLSDIEVTCKLSERSANQVGQATCRTFFNTVSRRYAQLVKGAK